MNSKLSLLPVTRRAKIYSLQRRLSGKRTHSALWAAAKSGMVVTAFLAMAAPLSACPMCKDSSPLDANAKSVKADQPVVSFNKSIYFMLGGLITIAGFTGGVMYRATKSD